MKYNVATGASITGEPFIEENSFFPWQPSTWPDAPNSYSSEFADTVKKIFKDSIIREIDNVIKDAPTLQGRGHIVALSILSAIDTLSSYAFCNVQRDECVTCHRTDGVGPRYKRYITEFFPEKYNIFADRIYKLYRNPITHSWNLFEASMLPDDSEIKDEDGVVVIGLINFFKALESSIDNLFDCLPSNLDLQASVLKRYSSLRSTAIS